MPQLVCNDDLPYTLPWGDMINVSGTYPNIYASYLGCDRVIKQHVVVKPPIITNLAPMMVCQGDEMERKLVRLIGNHAHLEGW